MYEQNSAESKRVFVIIASLESQRDIKDSAFLLDTNIAVNCVGWARKWGAAALRIQHTAVFRHCTKTLVSKYIQVGKMDDKK